MENISTLTDAQVGRPSLLMTIGGLFSGIGGFELGMMLAGFGPPEWMVEADPWRRSVLSKHFPSAEIFFDVRTTGLRVGLRPVDVIVGGFPCQDISTAGKGAGLSGERSGLWFEMLRIISDLRPRGVIIENSNGGRGRWLPEAIRGLRGAGYRVRRPLVISAAMCGASHIRARCFLIACLADGDEGAIRLERGRSEAWASATEPRDVGGPGAHVADGDELGGDARKVGRPSEAGAGRELDRLCLGGEPVGDSQENGRPWRLFDGAPTGKLEPGAILGGQHPSGVEGERRESLGVGDQPGLAGCVHGLSDRLDRLPVAARGWAPFRFPAGQGPYQEEWEPARVVRNVRWTSRTQEHGPEYRQRNWTRRVEATGDAIVPAVAYLAALALLDWMEALATAPPPPPPASKPGPLRPVDPASGRE